MTQEEVKKFYDEMNAVCHKYGMQGVVGMWFSGRFDLYGFFKHWDIADTDMKLIVDHIADRLEKWSDEIYKGPQQGYHSSATGGGSLNN